MPHSKICCGEYRKSQILFLIDAALINASVILTTGVFLSGFIIHIKGSDFIVALLNNSATWASILTVFSFLIFERIKARKKLLIVTNIISRILSSSIVFLPLIISNEKSIILAVSIMVVIGNFLWGFYQLGWMIWYMEIAPKSKKNDYIYLRMFILRIANTVVTVIAGYVLDYYEKGYTGFFIIYISALIFSVIDVIILSFIEEPEYKTPENIQTNNFKNNISLFFEPFRSSEFRNFLIFTFLYYLSLTVSTSFTSLYLIRYLNFDYGFITTINIISYILMIAFTRFWSRVQSRKGTVFVLKISSLIAIIDYFIYFFLTRETYLIMFFSAAIAGIGNSGFNIALIAHRFEIMPESGKTLYEGWFKAIYGTSVLLAPFIGKILMNVMPDLNGLSFPISKFQMLYVVSFISAAIVIFISFYKPGIVLCKDEKGTVDMKDTITYH